MNLEQPGNKDAGDSGITDVEEGEGNDCDPEPGMAAQHSNAFYEIILPVRGSGPGRSCSCSCFKIVGGVSRVSRLQS
ncbi:hypothetical protein D3C85_1773290 [compost metagenome]